MKLVRSEVIFNKYDHTYLLNGKELKGITGILSKHIFPKKYNNIPEYVLNNAADYGTFVHDTCELIDSLNVTPECIEGINYLKLKNENNLTTLENEYLVSDNEYFASSIDIVFDDLSIADIKTTYKFDKEYVSWQLSIYSYLFELQNPGLKTNKLYGVWLRKDKYMLYEVDKKPIEVIKYLLQCELNGEMFINPLINDIQSK